MSRKPSKPTKIISLLALSELLKGVPGFSSRNTIMSLADKDGLPFLSRPDETGNGQWEFLFADVLNWIIARRVKEAVDAVIPMSGDDVFDGDPLLMDEPEAKRRRAVWDAQKAKSSALLQQLDLMKATDEVIEIERVGDVVGTKTRKIRSSALDLPSQISAKIPDPALRPLVSDIVLKQVNIWLESLNFEAGFGHQDGT